MSTYFFQFFSFKISYKIFSYVMIKNSGIIEITCFMRCVMYKSERNILPKLLQINYIYVNFGMLNICKLRLKTR